MKGLEICYNEEKQRKEDEVNRLRKENEEMAQNDSECRMQMQAMSGQIDERDE